MFRIGFAKDIHRLIKGRTLILGGIILPYSKGEDAHSDGDVIFHSIGEALLGSLALGDLGKYFPGTPKYKNIDSKIIVTKCYELVKKKGYKISNIDISVELENFKLKKYILEIRENIAKVLDLKLDQVSLKANTNEKCDAVGKDEAIISNCIVLVESK